MPEVHQILANDRDPKIEAHTLALCEVYCISSDNLCDIIRSFDMQFMEDIVFSNVISYFILTVCGKFFLVSNCL